ncbi:hypothetical protein AGLY_015286 [Aphis glycines]|uniref:Uncharacterized protein n=1 Tax=Aphis glycines TaxID=307491 RepID=A0A6G0T2W7_APHGL|nr:hypothetical protein AGLY_015286 [Aphis glycines]
MNLIKIIEKGVKKKPEIAKDFVIPTILSRIALIVEQCVSHKFVGHTIQNTVIRVLNSKRVIYGDWRHTYLYSCRFKLTQTIEAQVAIVKCTKLRDILLDNDSEESDECIDFIMIVHAYVIVLSQNGITVEQREKNVIVHIKIYDNIIFFNDKRIRRNLESFRVSAKIIFVANEHNISITFQNNTYSKQFPTVFKKMRKTKKLKKESKKSIFVISVYSSNFYEICQNHENLQVKKFNTKFSIIFPSSSCRENSKHHYMKHFKCILENFTIWLTIIIKELKFWCIQAIKTQTTFFTNYWKLYPRLTNHFHSESFFEYNDTYLSLDSN